LNVQILENSMENQLTYQIVKIERKIEYIKSTNSSNLLRNFISLKLRNWENSRENYVHSMYSSFGFI